MSASNELIYKAYVMMMGSLYTDANLPRSYSANIEIIGVLGHDSALWGYTGPGTTNIILEILTVPVQQ